MPDIPFDASLILIDGQWRACASGQTLPLEHPSDGSELTRIARGTAADVDASVSAARAALDTGAWCPMTATERGRVLSAIGRQMRVARGLKCGQVFVNNDGAGGGVKRSGHGREKGFEALYGFSTLKTIAIHHD